jgi:hypothetical protein
MKSTFVLALLGLSLCWAEAALAAAPTKETTPGDQVADHAQAASATQLTQYKKLDRPASQHSRKEPVSRPPVLAEPLGPFSPLYIDP